MRGKDFTDGALLSINEMTTYRWSFDEDVTHYRQAQVHGIGVWRQKLADFGEEKGIELLAESGLAVSNLLWAGGFTGSDGRNYPESLRDAREAIRLAAAMKAGCLVVYSGGRNGHTQNHARRLFIGAIKELLPIAEEHNVTLAFEPMHSGCAGDWTFITTFDEALAVLAAIDSPHLKLAFDTYHLGHDNQYAALIPQIAERIAIVHLGDSLKPPDHDQDRRQIGDGKLPLKEIIQALTLAGYVGYYDIELMGESIEAANYTQLLEESQKAFAELVSV